MSEPMNFPPPQGPRIEDQPTRVVPPVDDPLWSAPTTPRTAARPTYAASPTSIPEHIPEITGSAVLDIPDAAGTVTLSGLDGVSPRVSVGGVPVKVGITGKAKIPMANGTSEALTLKSFLPGFPVVEFRGKVLYRSLPPTVADNTVCALIFLACVAFGGIIIGAILGIVAARGFASLVKKGVNPWLRLGVPGLLALALGIGSLYVKANQVRYGS